MSKRKVNRAWIVLGLAGALSGCGISDLIGDLKDLEDEFDLPDGGFDFSDNEDADGGAPERQFGVDQAAEMLDEQGGQLATEAGAIDVPAGALEGDTQITVAEVSAENIAAKLPSVLRAVAPAVAFTPHGQTFAKPVTLSLFHEGFTTNLVVLRLDSESDTQWERVDATFDTGVAYVTSTHFSIYNVSECDPSMGSDALCTGLVQGQLEVSDVPPSDFSEFQAPRDFGGSSAGGATVDGGSGGTGDEVCTFETICQVITSCRSLDGEPTMDPTCMTIEEEICWEECVTEGTDKPEVCRELPQELPMGCTLVPGDGVCPFEVYCEAPSGGGSTADGGVSTVACQEVPPGCSAQKAPEEPCGYRIVC